MRTIFALVTFLLYASMGHAMLSYYKLWGLYTYNGRYNDLLYLVEPQIRTVNRDGVYQQLIINQGFGFWATKTLQLWAGQTIVNYLASNNVVDDIQIGVTGEYRLWQQINYVRSNTLLDNIMFRNRLEERHAESLSSWAVRFRDRLYWTIPIATNQSIYISDEFFINVNRPTWISSPTFDQNRLYLGILQSLTPSLNFTISYLNQYIPTRIREVNHGIVLNVTYTSSNYFS